MSPLSCRRDDLARLLLDAYRDTVDDEGEDLDDARAAIDDYLHRLVVSCSVVLLGGKRPVALSFVVAVGDIHYVDPVCVATDRQRAGLGRAAVVTSLRALAADGIDEIGAVITDGNVASERLFASLGFERVGAW